MCDMCDISNIGLVSHNIQEHVNSVKIAAQFQLGQGLTNGLQRGKSKTWEEFFWIAAEKSGENVYGKS